MEIKKNIERKGPKKFGYFREIFEKILKILRSSRNFRNKSHF